MHLKNLGTSVNAFKDIQNILKIKGINTSVDSISKLKEVATNYSTEVLKLASRHVSLTKEQANAIFTGKGLKDAALEQAVATATLSASEVAATAATGGLTLGFERLGWVLKEAFKTNPFGWLAVGAAAVYGIVKAYDYFNESLEETKERLSGLQSEYEDSAQRAASLTSELEAVREKIEEIQSLGGARVTRDGELRELLLQEASLERQLAIEKEHQALIQKEATDAAEKILATKSQSKINPSVTTTVDVYTRANQPVPTEMKVANMLTTPQLLEEAVQEMQRLQEESDQLLQKKKELQENSGEESEAYRQVADQVDAASEAYEKARGYAADYAEDIQATIGGIDPSSDTYQEAFSVLRRYGDYLVSLTDTTYNAAPHDLTALETSIHSFSDAQKAAADAMRELSESGAITQETFDSLKKRFSDLDAIFTTTAAGITINKKALADFNKQQKEAIQNQLSQKMEQLNEDYNDNWIQLERCSRQLKEHTDFSDENRSSLEALVEQLELQRESIGGNILDLKYLQAEYQSSISKYNEFMQALSSPDEGSNYDAVQSSLQRIREEYEKGLVGTDQFRAFVDYMTYADMSTASVEELVQAYDEAMVRARQFYTESASGSQDFLNTLAESGYAAKDEDGNWSIQITDIEEAAQNASVSVEALKDNLNKLQEYGHDVQIEEPQLPFHDLEQEYQQIIERINQLNSNISLGINTPEMEEELQQLTDRKIEIQARLSVSPEVPLPDGLNGLEGDGETKTEATIFVGADATAANEVIGDVIRTDYHTTVDVNANPANFYQHMGFLTGRPYTVQVNTVQSSGAAVSPPKASSSFPAKVNGSWRVGYTGKALVGELGKELLVRDGIVTPVGESGAQLITLKSDDIIFNHRQTRQLEQTGRINSRGRAFSSGSISTLPQNTRPGSSASSKEHEKEFDWVARKLKLLEDKREELEKMADSSFLSYLGLDAAAVDQAMAYLDRINSGISLTTGEFADLCAMAERAGLSLSDFIDEVQNGGGDSRAGLLSKRLVVDKELLREGSDAVGHYLALYEQAADKLPDELRARVEYGGDDMQSLSDEEAEKVDAAIKARENYLDSLQKEREYKDKLLQDTKELYDNELDALEQAADAISHKNTMIEKQIDYLEASGQIVNAGSYEMLIQYLRQQEALLDKKIAAKRAEMKALTDSGDLSEDDIEYLEMQAYIDDCEESLADLEIRMAEYNETLAQLPIDHLKTLLDMLGDMTDAIENWGAQLEASGKTLHADYYQALIKNGAAAINQLNEQAELVRDVMDEYDIGSAKWLDLYNQLNEINGQMSSMVQNLHKWNEELLNMPLASISSHSDELSQLLDAHQQLQSDYESVVQSVTAALDQQKKVLEESRTAETDAIQSQIDSRQEQLDLLNDQNDELQRQIALEQALADLENASRQRTVKVIRDGEIRYEADARAISDAKDSVQDALSDIETARLTKELDDLNEQLTSVQEAYDEQLKQLDKISEKWQSIKSNVEAAQNAAKADEYLGVNWQDQIAGENGGGLFDAFRSNYEANARTIETLGRQIQTTENIYNLLEHYLEQYRSGTITYEQALLGIQALLAQMNTSLTSGQSLQQLLDYLGAVNHTDASSSAVLLGIQKALETSSREMVESLKKYEENAALIGEYETSWEALTDNVSEIRDLMEEVRDALEDAVDAIDHIPLRDDREDDEDETPGGSHSSGTIVSGGYSPSDYGPGTDRGNDPSWGFASGIQKGLVGSTASSGVGEYLRYLSTHRLRHDEVPILAHRGEAVLNPEQQQTLLDNIRLSAAPRLLLPSFQPSDLDGQRSDSVVINMGDIRLTDVRDVDGFAKAMASTFKPLMRQELGKR